jgi:cytoskeleton protein RodZ
MSEADSTLDVEVAPASPGRQLAAARESCGLSIVDIARQLKLSPRQVEAMEAGNYQCLPGAVFVRGFIRNYARLVKLDPAPLLAGPGQPPPPAAQPDPELPHSVDIPFPTGREFKWHKYAIVLLVLLVAGIIFEFYRDDATEIIANSRQVALPQPPIVAQGQAVEAGIVPPVAAVSDAAAKPPRGMGSTTSTGKTAVASATLPAHTASAAPRLGEHLIKLTFDQESWVEIRDRNGRRIFSQLNPAGTEQEVSGQPPLTLVVGNATGVRLTHNDQPVNLAPHIKIDVARLTLE